MRDKKKVKQIATFLKQETMEDVMKMKQEYYFDRPFTELYHDMIVLGIEAYNRGERVRDTK